MTSALQGLKVLDLSRFIAGPHCGMILGDLGADVVKVERSRLGDDTRALMPMLAGESIYFMMFNRNKRSMTLNFRDPAAQDLLRLMAAESDILIENFRPGTMEKMGCGWDELHAINPRLIMLRISGYGQNNSMAKEPCFDGIAQATSGIMDLTGQPDGPPSMSGTFIADYATALYGAIGALAALERRHRTGEGQMVDVSLVGSATSLLMTAIPEFLVNGRAMSRMGSRDRYAAPANTFQARDGVWIHMVGGNDAHFPRVVAMIKQPELLTDPRFSTLEARMRNIEEIEAIVAKWFAQHDSAEVLEALSRAELPSARIRTIAEVATDPYMRESGNIIDVKHPAAGTVPMQGLTIGMSESPPEVRQPAPMLGQHTNEVLADWLKLGPEDIVKLQASAVL